MTVDLLETEFLEAVKTEQTLQVQADRMVEIQGWPTHRPKRVGFSGHTRENLRRDNE